MKIECEENLINDINNSIKDFKATLFIDNLELFKSENNYKIKSITLDL